VRGRSSMLIVKVSKLPLLAAELAPGNPFVGALVAAPIVVERGSNTQGHHARVGSV
jgi:hypothetical protein